MSKCVCIFLVLLMAAGVSAQENEVSFGDSLQGKWKQIPESVPLGVDIAVGCRPDDGSTTVVDLNFVEKDFETLSGTIELKDKVGHALEAKPLEIDHLVKAIVSEPGSELKVSEQNKEPPLNVKSNLCFDKRFSLEASQYRVELEVEEKKAWGMLGWAPIGRLSWTVLTDLTRAESWVYQPDCATECRPTSQVGPRVQNSDGQDALIRIKCGQKSLIVPLFWDSNHQGVILHKALEEIQTCLDYERTKMETRLPAVEPGS